MQYVSAVRQGSQAQGWSRNSDILAYKAKSLVSLMRVAKLQEERRGGLARAPRSSDDVLHAALPILGDIRDSLQHITDVLRFRVRFFFPVSSFANSDIGKT